MKNLILTLGLASTLILVSACGGSSGGSVSPTLWSVTYISNGGTGSVPADSDLYGFGELAPVLDAPALTKNGFRFAGWTLTAGGTGTVYRFGQKISITGSNITLYARWIAESVTQYQVTYSSTGQLSGTVPTDSSWYQAGDTVTFAVNPGKLKQSDYIVHGWDTSSSANTLVYKNGDTANISGNLTVYAVWDAGRTFNVIDITDNSWYEIDALLVVSGATGTYCDIYLELENESAVTNDEATAIATQFNVEIYTKIRDTFAYEADVDRNGKVTLLLLDIRDGYDSVKGGGYVAGFFHSDHELNTSSFPKSNEADMLFMDIDPGYTTDSAKAAFNSTMAHEFQHLISWTYSYITTYDSVSKKSRGAQDTWINEGLSSSAEYVYLKKHLQSRIEDYNEDYYKTIYRGNNFFVWKGDWETKKIDQLANYSTVYLFFQWLRIHASTGTAIYKQILKSSSCDYLAVTNAASIDIDSTFSSWPKLLSTWMVANIQNESAGWYGYMGEEGTENITMPLVSNTETIKIILAPGEGIGSRISAEFNPPISGANIGYVGSSTINTIDTEAPYSGTHILVYNGNTENNPNAYEYGYITNHTGSSPVLNYAGSRSVSGAENRKPGSWPVDVQFDDNGNGVTR